MLAALTLLFSLSSSLRWVWPWAFWVPTRAVLAVLVMFLGTCFHSAVLLLIALTDGGDQPAAFSVHMRVGALLCYGSFIFLCYRPLFEWPLLRVALRRLLSRPYIFLVLPVFLGTLDYALLAWSTQFIPVAAGAVIFELWPVFSLLILAGLSRALSPELFRRILPLAAVCFFGFLCVVASQAGGFAGLAESFRLGPVALVFGLLPAVGAALVTSLGVCAFRCGTWLARDPVLLRAAAAGGALRPLGPGLVVLVFLLSNCFAISSSLVLLGLAQVFGFGGPALGWLDYGSLSWGLLLFPLGGVFLALGAVCWFQANALARDVGINVLGYLGPVVSLAMLAAFGLVYGVGLDYLALGVALIIVSNVLLSFGAGNGFHARGVVLALLAGGSALFFLPGWVW